MSMTLSRCRDCGRQFLQCPGTGGGRCRICNANRREESARKREEAESLKWRERRARDHEQFQRDMKSYHPVSIDSIMPTHRSLYIIGNGFDLMHRVPSSYYSFRDSLGKRSPLRATLEMALTSDDIWADFEDALGRLNLDLMGSRDIVDMWLGTSGFWDEDAGASEFYMAVEAAVGPIADIVDDLQPAFRKWVSRLCVGTDDRPLSNLISPKGKALSFNYTEFIETLYGVSNVCYIHGCRKNKNERLVLGYRPGAESSFHETWKEPHDSRSAAVDLAQDEAFRLIGEYNEDLTKNSKEIIENHEAFFEALADTDQIVVIGHSLSPVDWDYFTKVRESAQDAHWYFGVHGLADLRNLGKLVDLLDLVSFDVFRTDGISTKSNATVAATAKMEKGSGAKVFKESGTAVTVGPEHVLTIDGNDELVLPCGCRRVVILDGCMFIELSGFDRSVLLFNKRDDRWSFTAQLKSVKGQRLVNPRLRHVYLSGERITFVYNNRVRAFDLETGCLLDNRTIRGARNLSYVGIDIIQRFV